MTATVGRADKFEERRRELADAALQTLSELGYARTSLREIAQHTSFSHGVLHYYFRDKVELITYCVRRYKSVCVQRYDEVVAAARTGEELSAGFAEAMAGTLVADARMHRLWYDLRSQSLFEPAFRDDVREIDAILEDMITRVVGRYAELVDGVPALPFTAAYACFDGLFQQALLRHLSGVEPAPARLHDDVERLLALVTN
ncbi:TetR/AcrR family transcriptional regulator [Pseudonocardia humida]|uniref:TetR/AcrR family transcriptional regulator n=1 Tax=Pseudonocardia humida TaxID=2800819 RepID=A0ABT0ZTW1_9PSEU|nr:TetR/AcrR family transcriptional regulator [Pseudonocardia humida]MCO1654125.1 TetR/AcrR family transcriptional regulator [Pseudonocardia humida]